jgi:hypothetical protein
MARVAGRSQRARLDALGEKLQAVLAAKGFGPQSFAAVTVYADDSPDTVAACLASAGRAGLVVMVQKLAARPAP